MSGLGVWSRTVAAPSRSREFEIEFSGRPTLREAPTCTVEVRLPPAGACLAEPRMLTGTNRC